ncbi:GNAT family N-acetyltransferase [Patescibacteria group bacterium]|nr:GNAT family N-acetyltransferase [Patescibacteria group bacterium]
MTIDNNLTGGINTKKKQSSKKTDEIDMDKIPPQYRGLSSEVVDMLWSKQIFVDPEKTKAEAQRKKEALEEIRRFEAIEARAQEDLIAVRGEINLAKKDIGHLGRLSSLLASLNGASDFTKIDHELIFILSDSKQIDIEVQDIRLVVDNISAWLKESIGRYDSEILAEEAIKHTISQAKKIALQRLGIVKQKEAEKSPEVKFVGPLDAQNIDSLKSFSKSQELETQTSYEESLDKAIEALKDTKGIVEIKNENIPTIVISDLHARRDFLINVLENKGKAGVSNFDLLKQGKINIVCVGDGMHSEKMESWNSEPIKYSLNEIRKEVSDEIKILVNTYQNSLEQTSGKSYESMELIDILRAHKSAGAQVAWNELKPRLEKHIMTSEMNKSLGMMKMIMELKGEFPDSFHYTRGNHDDINERIKKFAKYANESNDVKEWIVDNFGEGFLAKYTQFEDSLPLVVKSKNLVVSHTVPGEVFTKEAINQRDSQVVEALTWTDNRDWKADREAVILENLKNIGAEDAVWIIGHRPVDKGNFREQFGGRLFQVNNDKEQIISIIDPQEKFDPSKNIYNLSEIKKIEKLGDFDMEYFKELEGDDGWIAIGMDNCSNQQYFTVLSLEGEKLGIIGVYDTEDDKNISHLVVDPKFRGQGLAAKFYNQIIKELGLPFTTLTINLNNQPSLKATEKMPGIKRVSDEAYEKEFKKAKFVYELPEA